MNQILVSEKVYVTPSMKRKKKFFKFEFFLSIFLVCVLSSYCIYAEYDRNKSEQVSKEILANIQITIPTGAATLIALPKTNKVLSNKDLTSILPI